MILQNEYWYDVVPSDPGRRIKNITGKWLIFGPTEQLHSCVPHLDKLVESGDVPAAKVARKLPEFDPFPDAPCVICAFTSDDAAEKDRVKRVLQERCGLDVTNWKSDKQTYEDWDEGGWLNIRARITQIRRILDTSTVPSEIQDAKERLSLLNEKLQKKLSGSPERITEAQASGVRNAATAVQVELSSGSLDSAALDSRILALESQIGDILNWQKTAMATGGDEYDANFVFVIMPFSEQNIDTYDAIKRAAQRANPKLTVQRVDDQPGAIAITDEIHRSIRRAGIVICDLTEERPNVYYELGFAKGIGRPLICLARKDTKIHFDVYGLKIVFFTTYRLLENQLSNEIGQLCSAGK